MTRTLPFTLRAYLPSDECSWLRCRTLSFLETSYYDDVWTTRPATPVVQLVAITEHEQVVGLLDLEVEDGLATIDTVAVHPDHQQRGIASALLEHALITLPPAVTELDAWTREDPAALAWYHARGFTESEHYLHVYKDWNDPDEGWASPVGLSAPVMAFCHARLEREEEMRARFARVYVCRRMSRQLPPR